MRSNCGTPASSRRILATPVDDPAQVTRRQMEAWAKDCDSWALTDACCGNLFDRMPHAESLAHVWARRRAKFLKRCGFVLMAEMAVRRKDLPDAFFLGCLPIIHREAGDDRCLVKNAVHWALRQIGKRPPPAIRRDRRGNRTPPPGNPLGPLDSPRALRELRPAQSVRSDSRYPGKAPDQ